MTLASFGPSGVIATGDECAGGQTTRQLSAPVRRSSPATARVTGMRRAAASLRTNSTWSTGSWCPVVSIAPTARRYRRDELLSAAGAAPQLLNDAISTGIIAAGESYSEHVVTLLRGLVALDRHGIEPRHLRSVRQSAERDVALIESAMSALLRRTDATSRGKANELGPELASQIDEVRALFMKDALSRFLS